MKGVVTYVRIWRSGARLILPPVPPSLFPAPVELAVSDEGVPPDLGAPLMSEVVRANLESSYVAYAAGFGLDPLIFEADIAPHFSVFPKDWNAALFLTPKIVLRMFAEESEPVKTPSYLPQLTLVGWFRERLDAPALYATLTVAHHSNGQDGPFFLPDGSVNHEDGSFATNFLEIFVVRVAHEERLFGWSAIGLEWHPDIGQDDELEGRYGLIRLRGASTLVSRLFWEGRLEIEVSAILDSFQEASNDLSAGALERFPVWLRYSGRVPRVELGVFAGAYFGHDYYNIWFDRMVAMGLIGISGTLSTALPASTGTSE